MRRAFIEDFYRLEGSRNDGRGILPVTPPEGLKFRGVSRWTMDFSQLSADNSIRRVNSMMTNLKSDTEASNPAI